MNKIHVVAYVDSSTKTKRSKLDVGNAFVELIDLDGALALGPERFLAESKQPLPKGLRSEFVKRRALVSALRALADKLEKRRK